MKIEACTYRFTATANFKSLQIFNISSMRYFKREEERGGERGRERGEKGRELGDRGGTEEDRGGQRGTEGDRGGHRVT